MLAATLTTVVVFFPVTFLYGVSKFLFSALALAVVISLFASYFVAMTVIPLFCARFLQAGSITGQPRKRPECDRRGFNAWFNRGFNRLLDVYERRCGGALRRPGLTVAALIGLSWPVSRFIRFWVWPSFRKPTPASSLSILRCPPAPASSHRAIRREG